MGLNLTLLSVLLVFNADALYVGEDGLLENSATFLFFLTALLLLAIAVLGRGAPGRWLYLLGALAFLFATGEEISWGQHIFGFETPDYIRDRNYQEEFNFHNLEGVRLYSIYTPATLLFCAVTGAAYFARKSSLFGVPFPSILLVFCLFFVYAYPIAEKFSVKSFLLHYPLFVVFAAYACFSRDRWLFIMSALFLTVLALQRSIFDPFVGSSVPPFIWEGSEYLLSIVCFVYAAELFLTHRAVVEKNVRAAYRAVSQSRQ